MSLLDMEKWVAEDVGAPHCIWGNGTEILWGNGEACMIAAATGLGKTTIANQLVAGLLGVAGYGEVMGFEVTPMTQGEKLLYLAMDRPQQAKRALVRNLNGIALDGRAFVFRGPVPAMGTLTDSDGKKHKLEGRGRYLIEMCRVWGINYLVIDSLKDLVIGLSGDEPAAQWNTELQELVNDGVNVLILHHDRKAGRNQKTGNLYAKDINDIYGSTWLTSGLGSVIHLTGTSADDVVEVRHLKTVIDPFKKFKARHDRLAGVTHRLGSLQDEPLLAAIGDDEKSISDIYEALGRTTASEKKQTKRDLERLVKAGRAEMHNHGRGKPATYSTSECGGMLADLVEEIHYDDE